MFKGLEMVLTKLILQCENKYNSVLITLKQNIWMCSSNIRLMLLVIFKITKFVKRRLTLYHKIDKIYISSNLTTKYYSFM